VDTFRILKDSIKEAKLIIIGSGSQETYLISKIKNYNIQDAVLHLKDVREEDLYSYYSISDLYISPTLQDDYIMSIQEAMVCGLPVVSTGQDWLVHEGVNGYLVKQKAPQMMADRIIKIYQDKSGKKMGEQSKNMIKSYDWNNVIANLIRIYEGTIGKKD
jgi:glycosyltransferase involved in cell wall biosynthesis